MFRQKRDPYTPDLLLTSPENQNLSVVFEKKIFYLLDETDKVILIEATREGAQFHTPCPKCKDQTLVVNDRLNIFHCYNCGWRGDLQPEGDNLRQDLIPSSVSPILKKPESEPASLTEQEIPEKQASSTSVLEQPTHCTGFSPEAVHKSEPLPGAKEESQVQDHVEVKEPPPAEGQKVEEALSSGMAEEIDIEYDFEDETYIKLFRKLKKNPIYKDSESVHLLIHLLLTANYKPNNFLFNGKEITVKRGQLITGRKRVSAETGISESTVKRRLKLFEKLGILTIKSTNKFSTITLCNYKHYQESNFKNRPAIRTTLDGSQRPIKRPATDQQVTTIKEFEEVKEVKKRKGSGKTPPDPRVTDFLNWFAQEVLKSTGAPYLISRGQDEVLIGKALALYDPEKLKTFTQDFLQDDQGKRQGFTIGVFYKALNRIAQKHTDNPLEIAKRRQREREAKDGKPN